MRVIYEWRKEELEPLICEWRKEKKKKLEREQDGFFRMLKFILVISPVCDVTKISFHNFFFFSKSGSFAILDPNFVQIFLLKIEP